MWEVIVMGEAKCEDLCRPGWCCGARYYVLEGMESDGTHLGL